MRKYVYTFVQFTFFSSPLIFRQPSLSTVSNIFVLPFKETVWIAFFSLSSLTVLVLLAELAVSIKVFRKTQTNEIPPEEILMTVIGHISQQGKNIKLSVKIFQYL